MILPNFIAIDFETATSRPESICEIGICIVQNWEIAGTHSWLVRPPENAYARINISIHGISPEKTANAPEFPEIWSEVSANFLKSENIFVAHNAIFDRNCLRNAARFYGLKLPKIEWHCSLDGARSVFDSPCNRLDFLCSRYKIPRGRHHRAGDDAEMCARLFIRELQELLPNSGTLLF